MTIELRVDDHFWYDALRYAVVHSTPMTLLQHHRQYSWLVDWEDIFGLTKKLCFDKRTSVADAFWYQVKRNQYWQEMNL